MKPEGCALDIAVVGLGQAGGNMAAEFARRGYRALALNTAISDLTALADSDETILPKERRVYIGIDGYDGAGADVNYGRECIESNATKIREAVVAHAAHADLLIVCAGLGGGTGSACSELVKLLQQDEDVPHIIVISTLPMESESGLAKVNAVRGLSELVKADDVGWIFVDNGELARRHDTVTLDRYFHTVNEAIITPLDTLNRLNSRVDYHPIRTLDGEDFRAVAVSAGVLNYAQATLRELHVDGVVAQIQQALQSSTVMPSGYSIADVQYIALVLEMPQDMLESTPFSFFQRLNEQLKVETSGAAVYLGVYRTPRHLPEATLRLICSSSRMPDGITAIVNDARREGIALREKLAQSVQSLEIADIEEFDLFPTNSRSGGRKKGGRGRRPNIELALDDAGRVLDGARKDSAAPSPGKLIAIFDEMVAKFEHGDEETRRGIAVDLDEARSSDSALRRHYADRAIQRIGQTDFESALGAARAMA